MPLSIPNGPPRGLRFLSHTVGIVLVLILMASAELSYVSWFNTPSDTVAYWDGGSRIIEGEDLYAEQDPHGIDRPYIYPPAFAAIFAVFVSFGARFGMAMWSVSHFLLLGVLLYQLWSWLRMTRDRTAFALPALLLLLLFAPLVQELYEGQVNLLVTVMVLCGLLALNKDRPATAGLLFAAAAHVKVLPGVIILFLLVQKKYRAAAWMAAGLVAFVLTPWPVAALRIGVWDGLVYSIAQYWHWATEIVWTAVSTRQVGGLAYLESPNVSVSAVLARMFGANLYQEPGLDVAAARSLSHLLMGTMLATSLWGAWRKRGSAAGTLAWPAMGIVALQLGNIICWGHHMVMLAIPATVLWYLAGTTRRRWVWFVAAAPLAIWAGLALLFARLGRGDFRVQAEVYVQESLKWGTFTWGALLIWALTAALLLHKPAPQSASGSSAPAAS